MTNKTWIGAAIFVLALVGAAIAGAWVLNRDDAHNVSAQEVIDRAAAAQTELLASVQPDSTLHVSSTESTPASTKGSEWWAYFDAAGDIAGLHVVATRDGTLVRTSDYKDGVLTDTFDETGEINSVPISMSIDMLRRTLVDATNASLSSVIAEGDALESADAAGNDIYVIEETGTRASTRVYIDAGSYRPIKTESIVNGEVVSTTVTPVFEFLRGNQVP